MRKRRPMRFHFKCQRRDIVECMAKTIRPQSGDVVVIRNCDLSDMERDLLHEYFRRPAGSPVAIIELSKGQSFEVMDAEERTQLKAFLELC